VALTDVPVRRSGAHCGTDGDVPVAVMGDAAAADVPFRPLPPFADQPPHCTPVGHSVSRSATFIRSRAPAIAIRVSLAVRSLSLLSTVLLPAHWNAFKQRFASLLSRLPAAEAGLHTP
jgi:hypothetical protein